MIKTLPAAFAASAIAAGLVAAAAVANAQPRTDRPGWSMWGPGTHWRRGWRHERMSPRHRHRMQRHWTFMSGNIPAGYQNLRNPLEDDKQAIAAGQKLYTQHCASCHGADGLGDGEAGNDLQPSPALLAFLVQMPIAVDSYLMWAVSEGGERFGTGMPAFKDKLKKQEIWQVISYLRNGFALP